MVALTSPLSTGVKIAANLARFQMRLGEVLKREGVLEGTGQIILKFSLL